MAEPGDIIRSKAGFFYLVVKRQNGQIRAMTLEPTPRYAPFLQSSMPQTTIENATPVANLRELAKVLRGIANAESG